MRGALRGSLSRNKRSRSTAVRSGSRSTYRAYRTNGLQGRFQPAGPRHERKFHDQNVTWTFSTTASTYNQSLTVIPRGTSAINRVGQLLTVKSLQFRGDLFYSPPTGQNPTNIVYVWLVLDTECNGTLPTFGDVFTSTDEASCHVNIANSHRFKLIKKIKLVFPPIGIDNAGLNYAGIYPIEFYMKCNIPVRYNDTDSTGVIENQTQNSLCFMGGTYQSSVQLLGSFRVRFTD